MKTFNLLKLLLFLIAVAVLYMANPVQAQAADDADCFSISPPGGGGDLISGQRYWARITMRNTGDGSWTSGEYGLGNSYFQDGSANSPDWGPESVPVGYPTIWLVLPGVPSGVQPGDLVATHFEGSNYSVTAPNVSSPTDFYFSWQMEHNGNPFGQQCTSRVTVRPAGQEWDETACTGGPGPLIKSECQDNYDRNGYGSLYSNNSLAFRARELSVGDTFDFIIAFENAGRTSWNTNYKLINLSRKDRNGTTLTDCSGLCTDWGIDEEKSLEKAICPTAICGGTFYDPYGGFGPADNVAEFRDLIGTAPSTPGFHHFRFQMRRNPNHYFGVYYPNPDDEQYNDDTIGYINFPIKVFADSHIYVDTNPSLAGIQTTPLAQGRDAIVTVTADSSCTANTNFNFGANLENQGNCLQQRGFSCGGSNGIDSNPCWGRWSCTGLRSGADDAIFKAATYGTGGGTPSWQYNPSCEATTRYTVTSTVDENPKGEHTRPNNINDCTIAGWACDPSNYNQPLTVRLFVDGPPGTGTQLPPETADLDIYPAAATQCGGEADHSFWTSIPNNFKDGATHTIHAQAMNIVGTAGSNRLLTNTPRNFRCNPVTTPPPTPTVICTGTQGDTATINFSQADWVDISTSGETNPDGSFSGPKYHKGAFLIAASSTTNAPAGFNGYGGTSGALTLVPRTVYYVLTYNSDIGEHSNVRSFSCKPTVVDQDPIGVHQQSSCNSTTGWACDPFDFTQSLYVRLYNGDPAAGGTQFARIRANGFSAAAESQCDGNKYHGFSFNTPSNLIDDNPHNIYVVAENIGAGINKKLTGTPKPIDCPIPPPPSYLETTGDVHSNN